MFIAFSFYFSSFVLLIVDNCNRSIYNYYRAGQCLCAPYSLIELQSSVGVRPDGDSMVPTKNLLDLLSEVEYPLGLLNAPDQYNDGCGLKKRIERLLPEETGRILCASSFASPPGEANFHSFVAL